MCNVYCDCVIFCYMIERERDRTEEKRDEYGKCCEPKVLTHNGRFKADNEIVFTLNGFCMYMCVFVYI